LKVRSIFKAKSKAFSRVSTSRELVIISRFILDLKPETNLVIG